MAQQQRLHTGCGYRCESSHFHPRHHSALSAGRAAALPWIVAGDVLIAQ
jgi:hypothetical protein